jgi:Tfp pilus assembly protein FimT
MRSLWPRSNRCAFTVTEVLITVLIMAIVGALAVGQVSHSDAGLRAERAAREAVIAVRFARTRAMTDGTSYKVRFNVAAKTISVINPSASDAVLAAPMAGAVMQINLTGKSDVSGVTFSPTITGDTSDPYDVTFTPLGATSNSGTVSFTYGTMTKTLSIPNVGDPTLVGDTRKP